LITSPSQGLDSLYLWRSSKTSWHSPHVQAVSLAIKVLTWMDQHLQPCTSL
jgi:hypothetical protein